MKNLKILILSLGVTLMGATVFAEGNVNVESVEGQMVEVELNSLMEGLRDYVKANNDLYSKMTVNTDGSVTFFQPKFRWGDKEYSIQNTQFVGGRGRFCNIFGFKRTGYVTEKMSNEEKLVVLNSNGRFSRISKLSNHSDPDDVDRYHREIDTMTCD